MQTFLPSSDFTKVAAILDYKRLGKQRVEAWMLLCVLLGRTSGWVNHPCTKMWKGHEWLLSMYGQAMCRAWKKRGYEDNLLPAFVGLASELNVPTEPPWWLHEPRLHISHQSNLIRKYPEFYRPLFGEKIPDNLPYFWPTKDPDALAVR